MDAQRGDMPMIVSRTNRNSGFTLIEIVIVLIVLGIIASVAYRQISGSIDSAKSKQTRQEMDQLAFAITGNPGLVANGARTDFGYTGDKEYSRSPSKIRCPG